jgi:hypothetical protein
VYFAAHGSRGVWINRSTYNEADANHFKLLNGRPVAYSAWHSHASYVRACPEIWQLPGAPHRRRKH